MSSVIYMAFQKGYRNKPVVAPREGDFSSGFCGSGALPWPDGHGGICVYFKGILYLPQSMLLSDLKNLKSLVLNVYYIYTYNWKLQFFTLLTYN